MNREELVRQMQNRFGNGNQFPRAEAIEPGPSLGEILRDAIARRENARLGPPHRDFAAEEAAAGPIKPITKLTGGKTNYYLANITHPQRAEQPPYQAECEDIIHALGMTFDEGCAFKALWRNAAARKGYGKPGSDAVYEAEKMVHYAQRILKHAKDSR